MSTDRPSAGGIAAFVRFYFRHWFFGIAIAVPIFLMIRDGEASIEMVTLGLAAGVPASVLAAFLSFRRSRAAEDYRPPSRTAARANVGPLPRSVITPPDAFGSRLAWAITWWTLLVAGGAALLLAVYAFATDSVPSGIDPDLLAGVLFVAAIVWLLVAVTVVMSVAPLLRSARLAASRPDALVLTAYFGYDGVAAGFIMRRVREAKLSWWRARLHMMTTLVVDRDGIEFWVSGREPRYRVPWQDVGLIVPEFVDVDAGGAASTSLGIALSLRVREDGRSAGWLDLSFLVGRSDVWITFPVRNRAVIESAAAAIDARRPNRDDLFDGVSLSETRETLAELEADGESEMVEEILDDLSQWLAARGGRPPHGGEWLIDRLSARQTEA